MTSKYATTANELNARLDNSAKTQLVGKDYGFPIEGQIPITFQRLPTGAIANFNPYYQYTELVSGTAISLSNAQLLNCINRELTFKCNDPGAATTLTLVGGALFNGGAGLDVATFDAANESVLVIFVTAPLSGSVPRVHVKSLRNVVLS